MNVFKVTLATVAIAALPLASSWAAGGSDTPAQTQSAAVAGASTDAPGVTKKPTSGTSGGGMSTGSGKKAGGLSKENKVTTTGASQ